MKNNRPEEWVKSTIGQICSKPQYGYTTKAKDIGNLKLLRTTDITSGKINWDKVPYCFKNPNDIEKYLIKEGDILISRVGSIGVSYLIEKPEKAVFASYLIRFKTYIDKIFVKYFLKSPFYWNCISEKKLGIAVQNINATKLKEIPIYVPPLAEQREIKSIIEELFSELDNGIESLKKAKKQIEFYRQSILKSAFEGKLTKQWRKENPDKLESPEILIENIKRVRKEYYQKQLEEWIQQVKEWEENDKEGRKPSKPSKLSNMATITENDLEDLPKIPNLWRYTYLAYSGELGRGKSKHRPRNDKRLFGGNYPFIQTGEVKAANGVLKTYIKTYNEFGLSQSKLWDIDTLCITIAANIAETCFLGIKACFPDSVVGFVAYKKVINAKYINYFIQSTKAKIKSFAPATAQKNINLTILENMLFPLCSLSEQNIIVQEIETRFSICDKLEQTIEESLNKAELLKQSILKKAFTGELTEEWRRKNPDLVSGENSAKKLLKRIKELKEG